MNAIAKLLIAAISLTILLFTVAVVERHRVLIALLSKDGPPPMSKALDEGEKVRWHDDYYTIEALDSHTYAIGEPRYEQQNYNYLIIGSTRAVLFDAGSGFRDIRTVVKTLTDLPVTFVPSHFHYDHVANGISFDRVAIVNLPHIRERVVGNQLHLTPEEHMGEMEAYEPSVFTVSEWLEPGGLIDLGGRVLEVFYTPGHTNDSISLFDRELGFLFSGDFLYPGSLYAFLPNSSLADYEFSTDQLLNALPLDVQIFGAHRNLPPGVPKLNFDDLGDLKMALLKMRHNRLVGEGFYPVVYRVNAKLVLLAEPPMLQDWQLSYEEPPRSLVSGRL